MGRRTAVPSTRPLCGLCSSEPRRAGSKRQRRTAAAADWSRSRCPAEALMTTSVTRPSTVTRNSTSVVPWIPRLRALAGYGGRYWYPPRGLACCRVPSEGIAATAGPVAAGPGAAATGARGAGSGAANAPGPGSAASATAEPLATPAGAASAGVAGAAGAGDTATDDGGAGDAGAGAATGSGAVGTAGSGSARGGTGGGSLGNGVSIGFGGRSGRRSGRTGRGGGGGGTGRASGSISSATSTGARIAVPPRAEDDRSGEAAVNQQRCCQRQHACERETVDHLEPVSLLHRPGERGSDPSGAGAGRETTARDRRIGNRTRC